MRYFSKETLRFLADLAAHNDRAWFLANKARYEEHVKEPALCFIVDAGRPLAKIAPEVRADPRPVGGSLFRIHRDVRFAKDKSPYKTHAGIHFRHQAAKDAHAPGFYLHIDPAGSFMGCGIWHPDAAALAAIRAALLDSPAAWKRIVGAGRFRSNFELAGESLQRPPRGVDPAHRLVADLKRKDFIGVATLSQSVVTGPDLLVRFLDLCRAASPFQRFLCAALDVAH